MKSLNINIYTEINKSGTLCLLRYTVSLSYGMYHMYNKCGLLYEKMLRSERESFLLKST
jgi:hypothetical protein